MDNCMSLQVYNKLSNKLDCESMKTIHKLIFKIVKNIQYCAKT